MKTTITITEQGGLLIQRVSDQVQTRTDKSGNEQPMLDKDGNPMLQTETLTIERGQIAAHRRDPEFEQQLTSCGTLTQDEIDSLPRPKASAAKAGRS